MNNDADIKKESACVPFVGGSRVMALCLLLVRDLPSADG